MNREGSAVPRRTALSLDVLGVPIDVVLAGPIEEADAERVAAAWSRCRRSDAVPAVRRVRATLDAGESAVGSGADSEHFDLEIASADLASLEERLTSELTVLAIGDRRHDLTMLHACGVADARGEVIALVAASGTGKTTASSELARSFGYVTDETVGITDGGGVLPYPKPLSVKDRAIRRPKEQVAPDALGLLPLPEAPLRLRGVVLLDRVDGTPGATVEPVELFDAICELVPQTSYLASQPRPIGRLLALLRSRGGAWRVRYGEAGLLPPTVAELFADPIFESAADYDDYEELAIDAPADDEALALARADGRPRFRRTAADDAVVSPSGELLVFANGMIVRLSGLAPTLWEITATWEDAETLVDRLAEYLGAAPEGVDPHAILDSVLGELESLGIVESTHSADERRALSVVPG